MSFIGKNVQHIIFVDQERWYNINEHRVINNQMF
jgi:hypothetical protein